METGRVASGSNATRKDDWLEALLPTPSHDVGGDPNVYFSTWVGPGQYDVSLTLLLREVVWGGEGAQDHASRREFQGVLASGWSRFSVKPNEDS